MPLKVNHTAVKLKNEGANKAQVQRASERTKMLTPQKARRRIKRKQNH